MTLFSFMPRSALLQPSQSGVTMTPGHVSLALRRLAMIDGAVISAWPLTVDADLAVGGERLNVKVR